MNRPKSRNRDFRGGPPGSRSPTHASSLYNREAEDAHHWQLAAYTGVTVRAVRHYHQRGLLAEPARDASGRRRYDGRAAVELIRIKTLAEAGMPLDRIRVLLDAEPGELGEAVAQLDEALKKKTTTTTRDHPGASA
jgi:hypothetical protein